MYCKKNACMDMGNGRIERSVFTPYYTVQVSTYTAEVRMGPKQTFRFDRCNVDFHGVSVDLDSVLYGLMIV